MHLRPPYNYQSIKQQNEQTRFKNSFHGHARICSAIA